MAVDMAHRSRSKTADSADSRKAKGNPRRLTEKIAIMKQREHEQSEAFEQAMKSIFEMQRARIHSGGGSMPSLQAIDSNQPPSIDMQSVFKDFNEVKRGGGGGFKERPHSGGPSGRRIGIERASSCETDPYPVGLSRSNHYWNTSAEWIEGDLSRHKSDSDLQQSLLMLQQQQPFPLIHHLGSPQHTYPNHKLNVVPGELGLWGNKTRQSSVSAALLSPDQYTNSDPPLPGSLGATSSLPDLTNIEFSSGLDVPLEHDDDPPLPQIPSFHNPTPNKGPGPSKLIFSSQAVPLMWNPHQNQTTPPNSLLSPPQYSSSIAGSFGVPPLGFPSGFRPSFPSPIQPPPPGGVRKSPTMPDFRTLNANPGVNSFPQPLHMSNSSPMFRPILPAAGLPNLAHLPPYRFPSTFPPFASPHQTSPRTPPPMTIIIQPPGTTTTPSLFTNSTHQMQPLMQPPLPTQNHYQFSPQPTPNSMSSPIGTAPGLPKALSGTPPKPMFSGASLPSTPTYTTLSVLPSYLEAKQQQALQQKFASINVGKPESLVRSHSEENLQKVPKEKGDLMHNPFMGNLANANSVPCVYVESPGKEDLFDSQFDRSDSPTPGDSPSTSASYASSPPSVRPFWVEQPHTMHEFVFNEWPIEGNVEKVKTGSPPSHHKSLTDLSAIPEVAEFSPNSRGRSFLHPLSLPSIVMGDLTVDEQSDRQNSPLFATTDFEMEDDVMDTILKNEVPDLPTLDVNMLGSDTLMSTSPDSFLHHRLNF